MAGRRTGYRSAVTNTTRRHSPAAAAPASTAFLYFVAKNDGSHAFSTNIEEHNRNVNLYQRHRATAPAAPSQ